MSIETEVDNRQELAKIEPIENTPFTLVQVEDQYFLAMGKYRLTQLMDKDDAIKKANTITWPTIMDAVLVLVEIMVEEKINDIKK